jgi:excisionase family DNA binding protein
MNDLTDALLDLIRPELEELVEAKVGEQLRLFVPPPPEPWMTTAQAARYLGLTEVGLRARAQRGTVPAHKDEGRWLFNRQELDAALMRR